MEKIFRNSFYVMLWLFPTLSVAQINTEFWFVAPEVVGIASGHADRPIYLRLATQGSPAEVEIAQPANPGFATINVSMAANSVATVDLTPFIGDIENSPAASVQNKGLHIVSDWPITVYYEVLALGAAANNQDFPLNPEIFGLKGINALGQRFVVPSQQFCYNAFNASESVDMVATQDNTVIQFSPSTELIGNYFPGNTYTITLNKGQTFSLRPTTGNENFSMRGTEITANKPIAVTGSDDSIHRNGSMDLIGDQLLPVEKLGTEYIVMRGMAGAGQDRVYIVATEDNTAISINGTISGNINRGDTYEYNNLNTAAIYISTNKPVCVMHLTGHQGAGVESTSAIVPPLGCSGTGEVNFFKNTDDDFELMVITRQGREDHFEVNGDASLLTASDFSPVPGTQGDWVFAKKAFANSVLATNTNHAVTNSRGLFHLGFLSAYENNNGNVVGSSYAFFSDYATISLELGPNVTLCQGDSLVLDAGPGRDEYLWNNGARTQTITVKNPGDYSVVITQDGCSTTDLVRVSLSDVAVDLGADIRLCEGETATLDAGAGRDAYRWSTGSRQQTIEVSSSGTYTVSVRSGDCEATDDTRVEVVPVEEVALVGLGDDYCITALAVSLSGQPAGGRFLINGAEATNFDPTTLAEGTHQVVYEREDDNGCIATAAKSVAVLPASHPDCGGGFFVPDLFSPNGDGNNERFFVQGEAIAQIRLRVFDRFGNLVYETDDLTQAFTTGWDGTHEGQEQPAGVYMWQVEGAFLDGSPLRYQGSDNGLLKLIR